MDILIRPARPDEAKAAATLWHDAWHDGHAALVPPALAAYRDLAHFQGLARALLPRLRLALAGGAIVGLYILDGAHLWQFYVAADQRGTGLAARLLDAAERDIAQTGASTAWLHCRTGNNRARRFYEKAGWQVTGTETLPGQTASGSVATPFWRMEKPLGPAIRPALAGDSEAIARMWHQGWRDAHMAVVPQALTDWRSLDRFRTRTSQALSRMHVAAQGEAILGMHLLTGDEIDQFYVAPQARGTGLAQRLIADAEARLAAAGVSVAWLACTTGNTRARRFYEKAGWHAARQQPMTISTDTDPIVITVWRMEKHLPG